MTKKIAISCFFFILSISFAFATNPVDPEKKEKEQIKNKKVIVSETDEVFKDLVIKESSTEPVKQEPVSLENKASEQVQDDDVQSFNFLYYIIHQFKFSDFVTH